MITHTHSLGISLCLPIIHTLSSYIPPASLGSSHTTIMTESPWLHISHYYLSTKLTQSTSKSSFNSLNASVLALSSSNGAKLLELLCTHPQNYDNLFKPLQNSSPGLTFRFYRTAQWSNSLTLQANNNYDCRLFQINPSSKANKWSHTHTLKLFQLSTCEDTHTYTEF